MSFEDHESRVRIFEPAEELVESLLVVGDGEGIPRGEGGHIQPSFGDVDANVVVGSSRYAIQILLAPSPLLPASPGLLPNLAGAGSEASSTPAQALVRAPPGALEGRDDPGFHAASLARAKESSVYRAHTVR